MNSVITKDFLNKPIKGKSNESTITITTSHDSDSLFIYDTLNNGKKRRLWISNNTALELATWILDNVSEDKENAHVHHTN